MVFAFLALSALLFFSLDLPSVTTTPKITFSPLRTLKNVSKSSKNVNLTEFCFHEAEFVVNGPEEARMMLNEQINHYENVIFSHYMSEKSKKVVIHLDYLKSEIWKTEATNEGYEVDFDSETIYIKADNIFGLFYGLEDISERIKFDFDNNCYYIATIPHSTLMKNSKTSPKFHHREILIDTARHYLPIKTIEQFLYSMAYARLNVLHWHIVDRQASPVCFTSLPELCHHSYSEEERYSVEDVKYIVNKAMSLGIRVIPEIDVPGHAQPFCLAYPNMCTAPSGACSSVLNVANEETFTRLEALYKEVIDLFPDKYIHVGGDEVKFSCWNENPQIKQWMDQKGMSIDDAYGYFVKRIHKLILDLGRVPIGWDEIYEKFGKTKNRDRRYQLDSKVVIQVWRNKNIVPMIYDGHDIIWSKSWPNGWYLDATGNDWGVEYFTNPFKGVRSKQMSKVMGGGGEMWGEKVDPSDLFNTVWPRAAAIAKLLWDGETEQKDVVEKKLKHFRCLLLQRGIGAAPLTNPKARSAPLAPGSCFDQ